MVPSPRGLKYPKIDAAYFHNNDLPLAGGFVRIDSFLKILILLLALIVNVYAQRLRTGSVTAPRAERAGLSRRA